MSTLFIEEKGLEWSKMETDISKIIGIFIMGEDMLDLEDVVTCTAECDVKTGKIFWDRHRKYFVNLPKFELNASNMTTKDIWINFFKNLGHMENIDPSVYERADEGLLRLIERAKIGALSKEEYAVYEASLKRLADEMDMDQHGYERGKREGANEKAYQIASDMKKGGLEFALISKFTGLTFEEIEKL